MALAINYSTIRRQLGLYLALGRDPATDWTPDQVQDVADIIDAALRQVYWPLPLSPEQPRHVWSFLTSLATITTAATVSAYDLPENFSDFASNFTFSAGDNQGKLARVSDDLIRQLQAQANRSGPPQYFAVNTKNPTNGSGSSYEVLFYPTPDAAYTLSYQYTIEPATLSDDNPVPLGGAKHGELFLEACLAEAEKTIHDTEGVHQKRFRELLTAAILLDQSMVKATEVAPWPFESPASDLAVNKAYLKRLVGNELQYGPHPALWDHSQAQRVKLVLESGLRKFYSPIVMPNERYAHEWSFLRPSRKFTLVADQYKYDLPEDFAMTYGDMTFAPGAAVLYPSVKQIGESQIMQRLQRTEASARPSVFAIRPKLPNEGTGTRYEVLFWPVPDQAYSLSYRYQVNPGMLSDEAALPLGGQPHMQTIIEACLAAAEESVGQIGIHSQLFVQRLQASISHDRKANSAGTLGYNMDISDSPGDRFSSWHDCDENIVTYNGVSY